MAEVDRYFRQVFNSPQLWKGRRITLSNYGFLMIDPQVLEILKVRRITDLSIHNINFHLERMELPLSHLERLSFFRTTCHILLGLYKAASSGHLNHLKEIYFGFIHPGIQNLNNPTEVTFVDLFKCLPRMEEVSFAGSSEKIANGDIDKVPEVEVVVQQALCCTGKLTSISLKYFCLFDVSWLNTVMINNPYLQKVSFCNTFIEKLHGEGFDPSLCSSLKEFELSYCKLGFERNDTAGILSWVFPSNMKPYKNLTSLVVTNAGSSVVFPLLDKFPALRKLNLAGLSVPRDCSLQSFPNFQNLEWLELMDSKNIRGDHLLVLSNKVGKTLRYLGLAKLQRIADNHLRDLPHMFPALRSLVLSQCSQITDGLLVEWYIKHKQSEWPKLRKLDLKGCEGITKEVVESVRLKTRNQLLIDL